MSSGGRSFVSTREISNSQLLGGRTGEGRVTHAPHVVIIIALATRPQESREWDAGGGKHASKKRDSAFHREYSCGTRVSEQ